MMPKIKTVGVQYLVKVNEEVADVKPTLRAARSYIKSIPLTEVIKKVTVVKLTTTEQLLDVYEPKQVTVLQANQLDLDLFNE